MIGFVKRHAGTFVVAFVTAGVTAGAPAIAAIVQHAHFADVSGNARKLGGINASGYYKTTDTVAHATTADTASNADKLDQLDSTDFLNAAPIMRADPAAPGSVTNSTTQTEINSLSITAPAAGFLVITGDVEINNNTNANRAIALIPYLDGTAVNSGIADFFFGADQVAGTVDVAEDGTLDYTVAVSVTAGAHTVSQNVSPSLSTSYNWAGDNLVVEFFPASRGGINP